MSRQGSVDVPSRADAATPRQRKTPSLRIQTGPLRSMSSDVPPPPLLHAARSASAHGGGAHAPRAWRADSTRSPRSPRSPSRLFGRAAAYAAQSLVGAVTRSLSPTGTQGYAAMLLDMPTSMSPGAMNDAQERGEPMMPLPPPPRVPTPTPPTLPRTGEAGAPGEHSIPMDDLVAPRARHGAVWLHPKPRRRPRTRRWRPPPPLPPQQQLRRMRHTAWACVCTFVDLVTHPRELLACARHQAHTQYAYWDSAFRDPFTDQRTWWPPWIASYVPLFVWVGVSITSTVLVMLFHVQLFHALDRLSSALRTLGVLGRVVFGLIIFVLTFPPMPLYSTMIVLSGFAFGMWQGFVVSYVAALLGASVVFLLSRTYLHTWMVRLLAHAGGLQRVVRAIELRPQLLFLVRVAPYPYNLLNMLLASSHVLTFRTYFTCTALALPKLLVHTSIGASIENFAAYRTHGGGSRGSGGGSDDDMHHTHTLRQVAGALGMALCIGIFMYVYYLTRCAVHSLDDMLEDDDTLDELLSEDDKYEPEPEPGSGSGSGSGPEADLDLDSELGAGPGLAPGPTSDAAALGLGARVVRSHAAKHGGGAPARSATTPLDARRPYTAGPAGPAPAPWLAASIDEFERAVE